MGSVPVVILLPCGDGGLEQVTRQGFVETLVAEAAVEAFDEVVLHRPAGAM